MTKKEVGRGTAVMYVNFHIIACFVRSAIRKSSRTSYDSIAKSESQKETWSSGLPAK